MRLGMACLSVLPAMAESPQSIFNGKDLAGWQGSPGWWSAVEDVLATESTPEKPCGKSSYLVWTGGRPADFQLDCEFRLSADANSGIQLRSETRPQFDTWGYQADMTGDGKLIGFIYHHAIGLVAGRGESVTLTPGGKRQVQVFADAKELLAQFKKGDWNHYRIICRGPEISLFLNGQLMCRVTDHNPATAAKDGIIALQMHQGPPMKAEFRNILLTDLKPSHAPKTPKP
ncbi:MAG: 3-keto-disaccharide hydrolase [Luteolibacter sp.]